MNILKKISLRNLKLNKKRTVATIMGITLSTALMIGIGLLFSSLKETMIQEIKNANGSHHAIVYDLTKEQVSELRKNNLIKNIETVEIITSGEMEEFVYYNIVGITKERLSNLELIKGRLPLNQNEVVLYEPYQNTSSIKLNEQIKFKIGTFNQNCETNFSGETKNIKVVGIIKNKNRISSFCGETAITLESDGPYNAYIEYKNIKDARSKTKVLVKSLGIENVNEAISFNTALLEVSGESKFDNFDAVVASLMSIALTIISIGCTIVIYNSFAISIIERKRQFGLLNSIGATKKQIKKSVYFESIIIGTIGIILGLIGAFIGIGIVVMIANNLLHGIMEVEFKLIAYPLYIIIPIIFMTIVIFASSIIPALIASRLSPIDSIKMKDDIKIKAKKLRVNGLIKKIFGFEATIAFKNMKRNKRKYRITILALFVSITMFIVFSSYMEYMLKSQEISGINKSYDIVATTSTEEKNYNELMKILKKEKTVTIKERTFHMEANIEKNSFTSDYLKALGIVKEDEYVAPFIIVTLDNNTYSKLLKKYNQNDDEVFIYNHFEIMNMGDSSLKLSSGTKMKEIKTIDLSSFETSVLKEKIKLTITNPTYINERIEEISSFSTYGVYVIMPASKYADFTKEVDAKLINEASDYDKYDNYTITVYTENHKEKTKELRDLSIDLGINLYAFDVREEIGMLGKAMLLFKILLYGFVSLIAAIGVTSVFNTLNTSIILRRREFAMLRSVGLSPSGFNKMIIFETLIFAGKSLLYSIPFSLFIVYQIHNSIGGVVTLESMLIPYKAIFISAVMVLVVVFATIMYSTKTIKKANILESLKDENI